MYGEGGYGGGRPRGGFGGGGVAPVSVGEELDVRIEAVGEKGDGIARKSGFVLFVPNTREGDEVRIKVTKVLRKVGFAEVIGQAQGAPAGGDDEAAPAAEEAPAPAPAPSYEPAPEDSEDFGEEPADEEAPAEEPAEEPNADEDMDVPPAPEVPEAPEAPADEPAEEPEEEKKEE